MSVVLYVLGALAVMVGAAMIGFGIPIKEFGIGNTLILAGVTTFCAGLVIVGLAAVVAQLHRLSEMLGSSRAPLRESRTADAPDGMAAGAAASRIPFPPKPRPAQEPPQVPPADIRAPIPQAELPAADRSALSLAPTLRNPDLGGAMEDGAREIPPIPPVTAMPAMPPRPAPFPSMTMDPPELPRPVSKAPPAPGISEPPLFDAGRKPEPQPLRPPQPNYFDTMWPADHRGGDSRPARKANGDKSYADVPPQSRSEPPRSEPPRFEPPRYEPPREPLGDAPERSIDSDTLHNGAAAEPASPPPPAGRAAAILKSGVVDGMGYTLYVDGSIEAELPQGTLRFGSINELREHLEKGA